MTIPDFNLRPKDFGALQKLNFFDAKYEAWIRTMPCIVCKKPDVVIHHVWHRRGNSFTGIPLCVAHHTHGQDSYHHLEHREFEKKHNIVIGWAIINLLTFYITDVLKKAKK